MLKALALVVTTLIVGLMTYAATRPDSFRVERAIIINASPEKIFPLIDDFHSWEEWSPWEKVDPAVQRYYSGAASGKGAVYAWRGNKELGQGRMEIIETTPTDSLIIKIDFIEPFPAHNTIKFTLHSEGNSTTVTQAMYGPSPYISKLIGVFFSMDTMVGGKFEQGLTSLKAMAER
ncbi:MAG: polyketide cyclase [Verrucomicrobiaceae bacterium]|nr:polyketide cyclase [Verrucomicrobiaceae bacterium]